MNVYDSREQESKAEKIRKSSVRFQYFVTLAAVAAIALWVVRFVGIHAWDVPVVQNLASANEELRSENEKVNGHVRRAISELEAGNSDAALNELRVAAEEEDGDHAVDDSPNVPHHEIQGLLEFGQDVLESGDLERASSIFRLAREKDRSDPRPWYWLGRTLEERGNLVDAASRYRQSLERDASYHRSSRRWAEVRIQLGDFRGAVELLRGIDRVSSSVDIAEYHNGLSEVASEALRNRLGCESGNPRSCFTLARAMEDYGRQKPAALHVALEYFNKGCDLHHSESCEAMRMLVRHHPELSAE